MVELNTPTLQAFVTPASFIFETARWVVALRPKQPTLGATVLISKSDVTAVADLALDDMTDLHIALQKLAAMYATTLQPDKMNYLALMMYDPNPHFHVIPRYAKPRAFDGEIYDDLSGWPNPPDLKKLIELSDDRWIKLATFLREAVAE